MKAYRESHAYLFIGQNESEVYNSAVERICLQQNITDKELLLKRIALGSHPDIMLLDRAGGQIKVETIRSVLDFIMIVPSEFDRRYVIINQADNLSEIVQNALLKILEEPPSPCAVFILASSADSFLPTVLSRVAKESFSSDESDGISEEEKHYVRETLFEIVVSGNIEKLFDAAKKLTAGETAFSEYLKYMLTYFSSLYSGKAGIDDGFRSMMGNTLESFAKKSIFVITQALNDLQNNASAQLLAESVFINILEEYNAENSRNQIQGSR